MISETLKSKLEELPEDLKREVLDYVEFSISKTQIVTSIMSHAAF